MSDETDTTDDQPAFQLVRYGPGRFVGEMVMVADDANPSHLLINLAGAPTFDAIIAEVRTWWDGWLAAQNCFAASFDEVPRVLKDALLDKVEERISELTAIQRLAFVVMLGLSDRAATAEIDDLLQEQLWVTIRDTYNHLHSVD